MGYSDLRAGHTGPNRMNGYGASPVPMVRLLDTNGDGTGTKNANGNYSGAADIFYLQPPSTQILRVMQLEIVIRGEKGKIKTDWYIEDNALSNGLTIRLQNDSGTITDFVNGVAIKRIGDYTRIGSDIKLFNSGDEADTYGYASIRTPLDVAIGYPLRLDGSDAQRLEIVLNDNFSSLDEHYFVAVGYYENE